MISFHGQKAAPMSRKKPSAPRTPRTQDVAEASEPVRAIRADAFDQFIEEQLQRTHSEADESEFEVVCHVY
jgi:hypothetical protein